jgi:hypothetical protein
MSESVVNTISLTGKDSNNNVREVDIDLMLWNKICSWKGDETNALKWLQLQIKLFSNRHQIRDSLSYIISSIAFVETCNHSRAPEPTTVQSAIEDMYQVIYGSGSF